MAQQLLDCGPLVQDLSGPDPVQVLVPQNHERVLESSLTRSGPALERSGPVLVAWFGLVFASVGDVRQKTELLICGDITALSDQSLSSLPPSRPLISWSGPGLGRAVELGRGLSVGPGSEGLGVRV